MTTRVHNNKKNLIFFLLLILSFIEVKTLKNSPFCYLKKTAFIFLLSIILVFSGHSANIVSKTSGSWTTATTWVGNTVPGTADNVTIASGHTVTVGGNIYSIDLTINGTLSFTAARTLNITGNFTNNGTFNCLTSTVSFKGSGTAASPQTINSNGSPIIFNNLTVQNSYVKLNYPVSIQSTGSISLNTGILETSTSNILSINKTATSAISGGTFSNTNMINGPLKWTLLNSGTNTYTFPIGKGTTYLPLTLSSKNTTANNTATVEAFTTACGGNGTGLTLSSTEYWSMTTSSSLVTAGSTVSIARPNAISPFNLIVKSTSATGTYTSLAGTVGTSGITNSTNIGTASPWYFTFGVVGSVPTISNPTATNITSNSVTAGANVVSNGGFTLTSRGTAGGFTSGVLATDNQQTEGGTTTGIYSHLRTGLIPQTLYYYVGYASNILGPSISAESSFRTLSNAPASQAYHLSGVVTNSVSSTNNTVTLSMLTPASFPTSGANQAGYLVIYSTGTPSLVGSPNCKNPAAAVSNGTVFSTAATNLPLNPSSTIDVTGLSACTTYNFLVVPYTWDGVNESTYNYLSASAPISTVNIQSAPFGGTAWMAGDQIEAENFDLGGQACAYNETGNGPVNTYRTDGSTAISLESGSGQSGYNVAYTAAGEWLQYTINVTVAGYYKITGRVATFNTPRTFRFLVDGTQVGTDIVTTQDTWQSYYTQTTNTSIYLTTGLHKLRVYFVTGEVNIDWIKFASAPIVTTPTATNITNTSASLGATISLAGESNITSYGTSYKTSSPVATTDNQLVQASSVLGAFSQSRTGLSPQTLYYYLAYASNNSGTGLSTESSFRTLSNPPITQANNLVGTSPEGSSKVYLSIGTAASFPNSGATQAGYLILYSTTATPTLIASPNGKSLTNAVATGTIFSTPATTLPTSPASTIAVTGLASCATYYFLVVPYTWDGINDDTRNYLSPSAATTITNTTSGGPYGGNAWLAGTQIEAENFDTGGQGCTYNELGGAPTNTYRSDGATGISLESGSGQSGYNIAYTGAGEWLQYTIDVTTAGDYNMTGRFATIYDSKTVQFLVDGVQVGANILVTKNAWQSYYSQTTNTTIYLTTGTHKLRVYFATGDVNLDWLKFELINHVTSISLNKSAISILQGLSKTLVATVSPANASNKTINWISSNNAIASVDANGKVSAVTAGTATITATSVDGGYTASTIVTVLPICTQRIVRTTTAPAIDNSELENDIWANATRKIIANSVNNNPTNTPAGYWSAVYDNDSIYILVEVIDANPWHNNATSWQGDGIELYIDGDNNPSLTSYGSYQYQYQLHYNYIAPGSISTPADGDTNNEKTLISASKHIAYRTTDGYAIKVALPWNSIKTGYLSNNNGLRMDVSINQSNQTSGTTTRQDQLVSFSSSSQLFANPSLFTYVPFFEVTNVKDTVITGNTNVVLSATASVTPDNTTWISNPTGNSGNGAQITVNQSVDTKYTITASLNSCASTSKEINALVAIYPDTIVWTNAGGDGNWDNYANWIDYGTKQVLNPAARFNANLTVIIPAPDNSEYLNTPVNNNNGIIYPYKKTPQVIKYSDSLYMKNLQIEDGASLMIGSFLNKNANAEVSLLIEDRNEWILIGPNIRPLASEGITRSMLSGDYYLNKTPQVYINEMTLDASNEASWGSSFANMDKVISSDKCFAIRIPDQYGTYKVSGKYFYRNDPTKSPTIGKDPIKYTFKGKLLNEVQAPTISTVSGKFVVACNTFMANISAKKFLDTFGGQLSVWSFNEASLGTAQPGAFSTYNSTTVPADLYIKPMQAFMYLDANPTDRVITLNEDVICDINTSTRYRAKAQVIENPTLEIIASMGNYSSKTSIVYNENLSDNHFDLSKDIVKLFSGYTQTPDIFSYLGENRLQSQTINNLNDIVNLGLKVGITDTVKLCIIGVDQFEAVFLADKQTNTSYKLSGDTAKIDLEVLAGTNSDRYYIKFEPAPQITTNVNENENENENSLKIYTEDNQHVIVSNAEYTKVNDISIVDMSGHITKILPMSDSYNIIDMSNYPTGIYAVKAITASESKTEKIIIK